MRPQSLIALGLAGVAIAGTCISIARVGGMHLMQWLPLLPHGLAVASIWAARRSEVASEICMFVAGAMAALSFADVILPLVEEESFLEPAFRQSCVWFAEMSVAALLFGGV